MTHTTPGSPWDDDWELHLVSTIRALGFPDSWAFVREFPGETYPELASRLAAFRGRIVAPLQVQHLQATHTPESDLVLSLRDSLGRHLRHAFKRLGWRQGRNWQGKAIGALISWSAMWSPRLDLSAFKARLLGAPLAEGWVPVADGDPVLVDLIPEGTDLAPARPEHH